MKANCGHVRRRGLSWCAAIIVAAAGLAAGGQSTDEASYAQGLALLREGKYTEAVHVLQHFCATQPNAKERTAAQVALVDAMAQAGQPMQAARACQEFIRNRPQDPQIHEIQYRLARLCEALGAFPEAAAAYKQYLDRAPQDDQRRETRFYLGEFLFRVTNQYRDAIREFGKFVEEYPQDPRAADVALRIPQTFDYHLNQPREAAEAYAKWLGAYPQDQRAGAVMRRLSYLYGPGVLENWPARAAVLEEYVRRFPQAADLADRYADLAFTCRHYLRQYEKAVEAYQKSYDRRPDEAVLWEKTETIRSTEKDPARRIAALQEYLARHGDSGRVRQAQQHLAGQLRAAGRHEEEIALLQPLVTKYGQDCAWEMWALANACLRAKRHDEALNHCITLANRFPGYGGVEVFQLLVQAAEAADKLPAAEAVLLKAVSTKPEAAPLWVLANDLYLARLENPAKAADYFRLLLDKAPEHQYAGRDYALRGLVEAYRALNDLDGAIAVLRAFHKAHDTPDANPRFARALCIQLLVEQKKFAEAVAEARAVLDPTLDDEAHAWALLYQARAYAGQGDRYHMLRAYAQLALTRAEPWLGFVHGAIDQDRQAVLRPLLKEYEEPPPSAGAGTGQAPPDAAAKSTPVRAAAERAVELPLLHHALGNLRVTLTEGNEKKEVTLDALYEAALQTPRVSRERTADLRALRGQAEVLAAFATLYAKGPHDHLPVRTLMRRAQEYFDRNQAAEAAAAYELLARRSPRLAAWAQQRIGEAYERAGQWENACKANLEYFQGRPNDSGREAHLHRAAWLVLERWPDAPTHNRIQRLMTRLAEKGGEANNYWAYRLTNKEQYLDAYEHIIRQKKDMAAIRNVLEMRRNFYWEVSRKWQEAGRYFESWASEYPDDSYAGQALGWAVQAYCQAQKPEDAVRAGKALLAMKPPPYALRNAAYHVGYVAGKWDVAAEMYRAWLAAYPRDPDFNEAWWYYSECLSRTGNNAAEVQKLWREIFDKVGHQHWAGQRAAWALTSAVSARDSRAGATLCEEMLARLNPASNEAQAAAVQLLAWYRAREMRNDEAFRRVAWLALDNPGEGARTMQVAAMLADFHREEGRFLDAAIALARGVRFMRKEEHYFLNEAMPQARKLHDLQRYEEAAAFLQHLLRTFGPQASEPARAAAQHLSSICLSKSGIGVEYVDSALPHAELLRGDILCRRGEEDLAFNKYLANKSLFPRYQGLLSAEYHLLIGRRLLARGQFAEATELARAFLIAHKDNQETTASERAAVQLFLGDAHRHAGQEELARDEYRTCFNLYPSTPQAIEAKFRTAESFLNQKMFASAEEALAELARSPERDVQIRAALMRGVLLHAVGKEKESAEEFRRALGMNPPDQVADELFFRLGTLYQERGKLKEAYNLYRLVGSGGREMKRTVEPGTSLRFRLSDQDLTITRGQASVPILVETTAGDRELVRLQPSELGSSIFVGDIRTRLGLPAPGDGILQVKGSDTVTYRYDPAFARDFVLKGEAQKTHEVRVAADATLQVSAVQIPEEKGEAEQVKEAVAQLAAEEAHRRHGFRNDKQIKPGNNIYIRVADADRSRSPEADTVAVTVTADSGDVVQLPLKETAPHSGVFRGVLPTARRPPDASASDFSPQGEPIRALSGRRDPANCWLAQRDARVPKWFMVDMKEVHPISRVVWHRGDGAADRGLLRYLLLASEDCQNWVPLAIVNANRPALPGVRVLWNADGLRAHPAEQMLQANGDIQRMWLGTPRRNEYLIDLDLGGLMPVERTVLLPGAGYEGVRTYELYTPRNPDKYPGPARDLAEWERVYRSEKRNGSEPDTAEWAGRPARYLRLRLCDHTYPGHPSIGEFEIHPRVNSKVTPAKDGIGATIECEPYTCRYLKLHILEYEGDAPALALFAAYARPAHGPAQRQAEHGPGAAAPPEEKQVVPKPGVNLLELAENQILEMTPGDNVTVTYLDEVNVSAGRPRVLRDSVQATFFDGRIEAVRHYFFEDAAGQRRMLDQPVYRVQPGMRFIVSITDYDADSTDGVDSLPFVVESASGQRLELTAAESGPTSGIFTREVDTAAAPRPGEEVLVLKPGERVTVSYVDEENTVPGHATRRRMTLLATEPTRGEIRVLAQESGAPARPRARRAASGSAPQPKALPAAVASALPVKSAVPPAVPPKAERVNPAAASKTSEPSNTTAAAAAKMPEGVPAAPTPVAAPPVAAAGEEAEAEPAVPVTLERPLTVEVVDPDRALDGGSTVKVMLSTSSGAKAEVTCHIISESDLAAGRFVGEIPLRLGDRNSPDRLVDASQLPYKLREARRSFDEGIPVLNANGSDLITTTYTDEVAPGEPPNAVRFAAARLVTDSKVGFFDDKYENPVKAVYIGDYLYLKVDDPDASLSAEKDTVPVVLESSNGDRLAVELTETLGYSGEFTRAVLIEHAVQPDPANDKFEADYDATIKVTYNDVRSRAAEGSVARVAEARVVIGSDGTIVGFGKKYANPKQAVETQYKIGESYFHLGKKHAELAEKEQDAVAKEEFAQMAREELAQGREVLAALLRAYPDNERIPEVAFLLARIAQEEKRYDEAIEAYERIVRDYPERPTAADAQYRIGICHEKKGEFEAAFEAYVQLAYRYPESTLVGDAMIRIGLHFFDNKEYAKAVHVFSKFIERHPAHPGAEGVWFKKGLALILDKKYRQAGEHLQEFIERFPEAETKPAALYWAGDAFLNAGDPQKSYQMFKRVVWDFPDSKWAKWARGRLTAPVFERIE